MENFISFINRTFTFNLGKMQIDPTYWQAITIVFLIFLLLLTLARVRYLYINWSLGKSAVAMLFWGFLLAVIFEGFMLVGGRTLLTEILGWKNVPKPISTVLDIGRSRLAQVLGESVSPVGDTSAKSKPTLEDVANDYYGLSVEDSGSLREIICKP